MPGSQCRVERVNLGKMDHSPLWRPLGCMAILGLAFRTMPGRTHLRQPSVDWFSQHLAPAPLHCPLASPSLCLRSTLFRLQAGSSLIRALTEPGPSSLLAFISLLALSRNLGCWCCPGTDFLLSGEDQCDAAPETGASGVACQRSRQMCGRNYPGQCCLAVFGSFLP